MKTKKMSTVVINKSKYKEIIWPLIVLYSIRLFFPETNQIFMFLCLALILIIIGFAKRIYIPDIKGLYPYLFVVIILSGVGLVLYDTRYVERDLFYVLPTIILVVLGYYLYRVYETKSIVRTIIICGVIVSVKSFINFLSYASAIGELQDLRNIFNVDIYEICLMFLIMVVYVFNQEKEVFGKKIDIVILSVFLVHILLSLSRSAWAEVIAGLPVVIIINIFSNTRKASTYAKSAIIISLAVAGVIILYTVAPSNIIEDYNSKVENTSEELNADQRFNSIDEAMANWRAYENQSVISQWKKSSALVQVFGAGLGKGTFIKFIPYTWEGVDKEHTITLLHNGYYTMLPKGGVLGLIVLIYFIIYPVLVGIGSIRKKGYSTEAVVLIAIGVAYAVQTYVVRGPIETTPNVTWGILVGWICGQLKSEEEE